MSSKELHGDQEWKISRHQIKGRKIDGCETYHKLRLHRNFSRNVIESATYRMMGYRMDKAYGQ